MEICTVEERVWIIAITTVDIVLFLSVIPLIYRFIKMHQIEKSLKLLFYPGIIFIFSTFLCLLLYIPLGIVYCNNQPSIQNGLYLTFVLFYGTQFYFLLLILFIRLYYVFNDTPLHLSSIAIKTFIVMFVLLPMLLVTTGVIYSITPNNVFNSIMMGLMFIIILFLITSLVILFLIKLITVYKNTDSDEKLVATITKTTILSLIAVLLTILTPITLIMGYSVNSVHTKSISIASPMFDVYTNFICVIFGYKYFNNYYAKICGYMDTKCSIMWQKIVGISDMKAIMEFSISSTATDQTSVQVTVS